MKKIILIMMLVLPLRAFADGIPASLPINQSIFQPETTRPLYNIERNNYTNTAIQKMSSPKENIETGQEQHPQAQTKEGLKGLFEGFTVEW